MLLIISGIITGILLNLLPLWQPSASGEMYAEWCGLSDIQSVQEHLRSPGIFKTIRDGNIIYFSEDGKITSQLNTGNNPVSVSGNGKYNISYQKAGTAIELSDFKGNKFWKIESREYPLLSYSGKIIFLMNGDQSRIRIIDINANQTGCREISGRLCTVIKFSDESDCSCIGFLDGSHYFLDAGGAVIFQDIASGKAVKSMSVSKSGKFGAVHYGSPDGDQIRLIDLLSRKISVLNLSSVHFMRIPVSATDSGRLAFTDGNRMVFFSGGEIESVIAMDAPAAGEGSIVFSGEYCSAVVTDAANTASLYFINNNCEILSKRRFEGAGFMRIHVRDHIVLAEGLRDMFCYSFLFQEN